MEPGLSSSGPSGRRAPGGLRGGCRVAQLHSVPCYVLNPHTVPLGPRSSAAMAVVTAASVSDEVRPEAQETMTNAEEPVVSGQAVTHCLLRDLSWLRAGTGALTSSPGWWCIWAWRSVCRRSRAVLSVPSPGPPCRLRCVCDLCPGWAPRPRLAWGHPQESHAQLLSGV